MIILDTNVVSELMKSALATAVTDWLGRQSRQDLSTTSITKAEILYGVARLPEGRRKTALSAEVQRLFGDDFPAPLLAFDDLAAVHYASILDARRRAGRPIATLDAQIAAIALAAGAVLATRNVRDFDGCGLMLVDPWAAS